MFHASKSPIPQLLTHKLLPYAACAAMLALAGCGHSDKVNEAASADNVEMPAEETMSGLGPSAVPQADPSATAMPTDQPAGADASASAADSAAQATSGPRPDAPSQSAAPSSAAPSPAAPIHM